MEIMLSLAFLVENQQAISIFMDQYSNRRRRKRKPTTKSPTKMIGLTTKLSVLEIIAGHRLTCIVLVTKERSIPVIISLTMSFSSELHLYNLSLVTMNGWYPIVFISLFQNLPIL